MRKARKDNSIKICPYCESKFVPSRKWQKFCSRKHQQDYHTKQTRLAREAWRELQDGKNEQSDS